MIEEAQTETPSEQLDRITKAVTKFEMVNCLITILGKEVGLGERAELKEILIRATEIYQDYYKSMEEFNKMTKR